MAKFIGRKVEAAVALEASRGVGIAPVFALGKTEFSLADKIVEARDESSIGNIGDSNDKYVEEQYAQGSMAGILGANTAAYLFALCFGGTPTVGSPTNSVYPWTVPFSNTNQHKSASLLVKDGNLTELYKLVMLEQLELSAELEDMVRYSAEFISKKAVTSGQSIPSYIEDYKFGKRKVKIKIAAAVGDLAAAAVLSLKSFKVTFNKNLTRDSALGTVEPEDILNKQMSIEGELKLNLTDQTYRNYMLNGDRKAMRISFEAEKLPASTTYPSIEIDLPKVDFFSWEPDRTNDDIVMNQINFKANVDATYGIVESVTVNNTLASL